MFWRKKKVQIKYSFVVSFYGSDKAWRGDLLAADYTSVLKYIWNGVKRFSHIEKIIVRESKGYDGRHLAGYCSDCGKYIEQEVFEE
jgi:hypothetical protein